MELDLFLNDKSISVLQSYYFFWTGSSQVPWSKAQLLRGLRQAMLDRHRVAKHLAALGETQLLLVKQLLRSPGFRWGPTGFPEEVKRALEELESVGFLHLQRQGEGEEEKISAVLPADFAALIAEVSGIDLRPIRQVFSLEGFLETLPDERRAEILREWLGDSVTVPLAVEALAAPEHVSRRLASLGADVEATLRQAAASQAGVIQSKTKEDDKLRARLEAALVGTVSSLELVTREFSLKGKCIIIFQEVVPALCRSFPAPAPGPIRENNINFLCDVSALARLCLSGWLRVRRTGEPYAGSRKKAQENMFVRGETEQEEAELLNWKLAVAGRLGLVELDSEKARCKIGSVRHWEELSLARKLRRLRDAVIEEPGPAGTELSRETRQALAYAVAETSEGWQRIEAVTSYVASKRLLASVADSEVTEIPQAASAESFAGYLRGMQRYVEQSLFLAGLVELSQSGREALVRWSQWHKSPEGEAEKDVLVGPNFELLVLRETVPPQLKYTLERFAIRYSVDKVWRYRIEPESIKLAVVSGMKAEDITILLESRAKNELPQNVRYSILDWAGGAHVAQGFTTTVFEADSADALKRAMGVAGFRQLVSKTLNDRTVCLRSELAEEVVEELREAGVYVDW